MKLFLGICCCAASLAVPAGAAGADLAADLADRFARVCMTQSSPFEAAHAAAKSAKWELDRGLSGVDMPNPNHVVTTQTWHAGKIGDSDVTVVATNVDSGKCRLQACGVTAEHFPEKGLEAALAKRLGLAAPASRSEDAVAVQAAWPLEKAAGRVVTFAAQKSLTGTRVTLTVARLCPQS